MIEVVKIKGQECNLEWNNEYFILRLGHLVLIEELQDKCLRHKNGIDDIAAMDMAKQRIINRACLIVGSGS